MDAAGDNVVELRELGGGDGRLRLADAVIGGEFVDFASTHDAVVVFVAPFRNGGAVLLDVGRDQAAVAAGDVLEIVEGVAGEIADEAYGRAAVAGTPGLRAVLDEGDLGLARDGREGGEVGGIAREM